jgi:molecular chaperone HscB
MDPFATLGLPRRYEIDQTQLEVNYRELQRALHPDRHAGASASQRRMSTLKAALVNEAYRALKDDLRRAEALLALYDGGAVAARPPAPPEDPEFLMQMLELREALAEAKGGKHAQRVQALRADVEALQGEARAALNAAFTALAAAGHPAGATELDPARHAIGRLKYFRRFLDEVDAAHEQEQV